MDNIRCLYSVDSEVIPQNFKWAKYLDRGDNVKTADGFWDGITNLGKNIGESYVKATNKHVDTSPSGLREFFYNNLSPEAQAQVTKNPTFFNTLVGNMSRNSTFVEKLNILPIEDAKLLFGSLKNIKDINTLQDPKIVGNLISEGVKNPNLSSTVKSQLEDPKTVTDMTQGLNSVIGDAAKRTQTIATNNAKLGDANKILNDKAATPEAKKAAQDAIDTINSSEAAYKKNIADQDAAMGASRKEGGWESYLPYLGLFGGGALVGSLLGGKDSGAGLPLLLGALAAGGYWMYNNMQDKPVTKSTDSAAKSTDSAATGATNATNAATSATNATDNATTNGGANAKKVETPLPERGRGNHNTRRSRGYTNKSVTPVDVSGIAKGGLDRAIANDLQNFSSIGLTPQGNNSTETKYFETPNLFNSPIDLAVANTTGVANNFGVANNSAAKTPNTKTLGDENNNTRGAESKNHFIGEEDFINPTIKSLGGDETPKSGEWDPLKHNEDSSSRRKSNIDEGINYDNLKNTDIISKYL